MVLTRTGRSRMLQCFTAWAACALLCATGAHAAPKATSSAPAEPSVQDLALARTLQGSFDALARLRLRGTATSPEVAAAVDPAVRDIRAAQQQLRVRLKADGASGASSRAGASARDEHRLRERLCSLELLVGDLKLEAAGLLTGEAATRLLDETLELYRQARIEYRTLTISMMGYVGEARVRRARRETEKAKAALQTVLDAARNASNSALLELGRIAMLERLELLLEENPEEAVKQATTWRGSRPISADADWTGRADWLLARARSAGCATGAASRPDASGSTACLQPVLALARSDTVVQHVPRSERLRWLVGLEAQVKQPLMLPQELLEWAELLAGAGVADALGYYQRCAAAGDFSMPVDSALRYTALLIEAKAYAPAVAVCRSLSAKGGMTDEQDRVAARFESACLLQLFREATAPAERAAHGDEAARVLLKIVSNPSAGTQRQECLREWTEVVGRLHGLQNCVSTLERYADLVEGDAYLLYAQAAGAYHQIRQASTMPAGRRTQTRPAPQAPGALLERAERAQRAAGSDSPELGASIALLKATVQAGPPQPDRKAALQTLIQAWPLLEKQPQVLSEAAQIRLRLLVELGLTGDALTFVDALPASVAGSAGEEGLLSLAAVLADRLETGSAVTAAEDRRKVSMLCQRAVAGANAESEHYVETVARAGRILLQMGSPRDARALLEGAMKQPQAGANAELRRELLLMIFDAYRQERNLNAAAGILDQLAAQSPRHHQVLIARGEFSLEAGRTAEGLQYLRQARSQGTPGSVPWCEATLALVRALRAHGQPAEAADVIRVGLALYPDFGNPQLLAALAKLRTE